MPYLVILKGLNLGQRFDLKKGMNTIGRNPDCEVVLGVSAVSREHARIHFRDNKYFIEDLKSRNLTYVNDVRVEPGKQMQLGAGDRIRICDFVCEFVDEYISGLPKENLDGSGTVISSIQAASSNILAAQPAERLRVILDISNRLARTLEIGPLLPRILDGLFQVFRQADRGFVIVRDEQLGQYIPTAIKTRREHDESSARFSRTILNKCMDRGEAFLVEDTAQNEQLQLANSISDFKVRSIMAAPMVSPDGTNFGVIQIDTQNRQRKFTQEDLHLLAAVASQAAIAWDNVRMHEDLVIQRKTQHEIELAREVQQRFLPNCLPVADGYDFFAHYQAASEVGGDFYGFLSTAGGRLAISVGDVAGKGIPAALLMARISGDVNLSLISEPDPAQAVMKMNSRFQQSGISDRFVAYLLGVLAPESGQIILVNAGQFPPLLRRANGSVEEHACNERSGLPLGVISDFPYQAVTVQLEPGDSLFMCTDGITDATDLKNQPFGKDRLIAALQSGPAQAQALGEHVLAAVHGYANAPNQFDDITLVCLSRRCTKNRA